MRQTDSEQVAGVHRRGRRANRKRPVRRTSSSKSKTPCFEQLEVRATPGSLLVTLPGLFASAGLGNRFNAPTTADTFDTNIQRRIGGGNLSILPRPREIEPAQRKSVPRSTTPIVPAAPPLRFHSVVDAASNASTTGPEINLGFHFGFFADPQGAPDSRDATGYGLGDVLPHTPASSLAPEGGTSFDASAHSFASSSGSNGSRSNPLDTADGNTSSSNQSTGFLASPSLRVASQSIDPDSPSAGAASLQPPANQPFSAAPGDVNTDGRVDVFDINTVSSHWGATGPGTSGDANDDRVVDIFDINLISANWTSATDTDSPLPPQPADAATRTLDFSGGLADWTVGQNGGSALDQGTVVADQGDALMTEGDSFLVTLKYRFTVPAGATHLSFTYEDLAFDLSDLDSMNDAFEAALLDGQGHTLVYTIGAGRDSYFNTSEELPTALGSEASQLANKVTLDLTGVLPETEATLAFRLVNNDSDRMTSVRIVSVEIPVVDSGIPPSLGDLPNRSVDEQTLLTFQATATDSDGTGQGLAFSLANGAPSGAAIDSATGVFTWTPTEAQGPGVYPLTVSVTDPTGLRDAKTFSITVGEVNRPPHIDPIDSQFVGQGNLLSFTAHASDDDLPTQSLTFSLDPGAPLGAVIDSSSGAFSWIPDSAQSPGVYNVTVRVTDSGGLSAAQPVAITVTHVVPTLVPVATKDDGEWAYREQGIWQTGTLAGGWKNDYRVQTPSAGSSSAIWTLQVSPGQYEVFTSWVADGVNATNAPYTISDGNTLHGTSTVDQQLTPSDGAFDGSLWKSLGTFTFATGVANIVLRNQANGNVAADGVLLVARSQAAASTGESGFGSISTELRVAELNATTDIDFAALSDVSASVRAEYGRTSFAEDSNILHVDLALQNVGTYVIGTPLIAVVKNISDPSVSVRNATGKTLDGIPYYDFSSLITAGDFATGTASASQTVAFYDPQRVQFSYDLVVLGQLNRAPMVTTSPDVEAIVGKPYVYDVDASDLDGDALAFSLLAGPTSSAIDPATGEIAWSPTAADLGTHTVIVQVDDGQGGSTKQRYELSVIEPPANRPPLFTSIPLVAAEVNTAYRYQAQASDADGDALTFSLASGPAGMTVDASSGLVAWTPAGDQVGAQDVVLQVSDGRGGTATQSYTIIPGQQPGNTAPIIISQPVRSFDVPQLPNPASGDVTPIYIDLDLGPGESSTQTVSLTLPPVDSGQSFADILFVVDETITMAGDHDWLEAMIPQLDAALQARGIGPNRYILVGFGDFITQDVTRLGHPHNLIEGLNISMFGPTSSAVLGSQTLGPLVPLAAFEVTASTTGPQVVALSDTTNRPGAYRFHVLRPAVTTVPLTLGALTSGTIDVPSEKDAYTFNITQPSRVYFDALTNHSGVRWSLSGPAGTLVNNLSFSSSDVGFGPGSLSLVPGDYTLTISADSSVVTPYQFRLSELAMATPLVPGTPVTGSLDPANETDLYRFDAAAGDRFFFDYLGGSQSGNPFWRLVDPYGNVLFRKEFRPVSQPDVDTLTLAQPGAYTLLVEGFISDTAANAYSINVQPAPITTSEMVLGELTTGAIAAAGEQDRYTFTLNTQALFYFDALTNDSGFNWTLTGPAGTPVLNRNFTSFEANFPLLDLVAGDYTLTVDGNGDATGAYAFRASALSSASALTPGTPVSGNLDPPNETELYSFTAAAGDRFSFDLQARTNAGNSRWRLINPYGGILFNSFFNSDVATLTLSQPGNYTLLLEGGSNDLISGSYTFVVVPQGNVPPTPPPSTPLTLGATRSDSISAAGEQDHYSFNLANASLAYFDALTNNGSLNWTLTGPAGTVVSPRSFTASEVQSGVPPLNLVAGAYILTVAASGGSTGNYSFRLSEMSQGSLLTPGTPVSGSLNPANETDIYQFSAAAGQQFYFDVQANTNTGNTRWRLVDPYGNVLFDNFFVDTAQSDVDVRTLAQAGTYTLLLEGAIGNTAPGSYTFNVQPAAITFTPLTVGNLVTGSISATGEEDRYTFTLPTSSQLYFDSHTNNSGLIWSLTGPAGVHVNQRLLTNDSGLTNPVVSVPAGDYTLSIDAGPATGNYEFRLSNLSAAAPLIPGTPVSGQLSPGNETDLYQFTAAAGDRFFFDVQARPSSGFSRWQLIDPYGNSLFNNFFVDTSLSDVDVRTLTQPGTYTLLLEGGISETAIGPYTINVQPVTTITTPLTLGELVSSSIGVQGEQDQYTFTLAAEARLVFDSLTNNGTLNWTLTGPTGPVVSGRALNASDGFNVTNPVVNVPAGEYTLTIDGVGDLGGVYSFRLSDLAAAALLTPGTPVSGTLSPANETDMFRFDVTAGDRFYFDAQARAGAPSARWRLINPFGAVRFSSPFSGPASDVGDVTLGTTGTFTLLIEGAIADTAPGTYTFNVQPSPINITPLALGSTTTNSIAVAGEQDRYNFSLAAPAVLYFDAQTNNSNLLWTLAGPAGTHVSARALSDNETNQPMLNLPAGDYSLTVHSILDATGPYAFRLSDLSSATPLAPGTPVSGSLSPGNESDIYSFTAAAGDLFSFDVQARTGQGARWRLIDPLGNVLFNDPFDSAANFVDTRALALAGRYTLLVEGVIGATTPGTYTFNVQPVTIVTQPLTLGSTVTDSISVTGELDRYSFTLPAASLVYFDALANNSGVTWTLSGPAGTPVFNRSFTTTDPTPILSLPAGDYTLTVDGFAKGTGAYSFRVSELSSASALTPGTPVSGSLSPANETDLFRFTALANERYSFDVQERTNGGNSRWRLADPLGNVVFLSSFNTTSSDVGTTTLLLSGQYTLLLEGGIADTAIGSYTFNVVPQGSATPPTPPPSTPLVLGTTVSSSISAAGEQDRYTFTLPAAALLCFDSLTNNANLTWSLTGPTGTVVNNTNFTSSDAANGNPVLSVPAGDYTLTVVASGNNTGAYAFRLSEFSSAVPLTPGILVSGSFDPANETDLYRFSASAGERFYFDTLSRTNAGNDRWRLVDPFGNILFFGFFTGADVDVITLAQPGAYTLLLEGGNSNTSIGNYTINVHPVPSSTTPLALGSVTSGALTTPGEQDRYTFTLPAAAVLCFDSLTNNANLLWSLSGPSGTVVNNINFTSSDAVNGNPILRLPAGDYTLTIDATGDATGNYAFRLSDLSSATPITPRTPFNGSLNPGSETDLYQFTAAAGEQFYVDSLAVSGPGGRWRLVDPFGNILFSNVFGVVSTIESDVLTLQAGNHTLLIEGHVINTATSSYTINVQPVAFSTQPVAFGQPVNAALSVPGEQDNYTFTGVAGQRIFFDRFGPAANITANLFAPSTNLVFSAASSANFGPFFLPETGTYRLNFDASGDVFGGYGFQLHDVANMPQPDANGDIAGVLDQHLGSDLFLVDAAAGQTLVFTPAVDLFVGTAQQVSDATRSLLVFGNIEDGYEAIDAGLRLDAFREGAAVNVVLVTDENRDVLDPNLTFTSTFTALDSLGAKVNGIHEATFRDGLGRTALGVDSQGIAYLADGAGGFIAAPGGVFVTGRESTKEDYIDLEWALDGAAWDTAQLRGGGLPAVSFTKAFVEIKAREIAEQLALDVVASDPNAGFQNLTGVRSGVGPGEAASFDVTITGDGNPQSFDLLFVRPGTNVVLGSIPVTINASDYIYPVQAVDADGDTISYSLLEAPFGATIDAASGRITWSPPAAGVYRFVLEADDGRGGRDTQEYEVTVTTGAPNQSPTITSTAPEQATEELPFGYAVTATDPDGDLLSYFLTQAPEGMAIDGTTGLVTWTPTVQQIGTHDITERVLDGRGGEATQSFTLLVVADTGNRAPQIVSTPITDAFSGDLYRYEVAAADADGDALAFDLVVKPSGMTIDQTSGEVAWRPTREHVGQQHVIVRVRDGRGGVELQSYDVMVGAAGTAPLILPPPPTAPAVALLPYGHRFHAQDADGDALTFLLTAAADGMTIDPNSGVLSWLPTVAQLGAHVVIVSVVDSAGLRDSMEFVLTVVASAPNVAPVIRSAPLTRIQLGARYLYAVDVFDENNDQITLTMPAAPAGMTLDPTTRLVEWVLAPDQLGDNTVQIRADDGRGGFVVQSFVISVAATVDNEAPRIVSTPQTTATRGAPYAYNLLGIDPDGDPLVWSLDEAPRGMSIDAMLGSIRWTPAADQVGPANVVVRVTDAQGGRATQSFTINVGAVNQPPVISSAPPTQGNVNQPYRYDIQATDPDGDPLPVLEFLDGTLDPTSQVSWWRADGNTIDDRGDNNGVLQNGATFATGKFGLAFDFDGINDHVVVPDNANLRPPQFTLEAWIKPTSTSGFDSVIAKGASGLTPGYHGDANAFWLGLAEGKPRMYTGHFTTLDHFITGDAALAPNEWHHIAGSFDGTTTRLYADGVLVASATVASPLRYDNLTVPLTIGEDWVNGAASGLYPFHGQIDEPGVYNRALTLGEIQAIFNADLPGKLSGEPPAGIRLTAFPAGMSIDAATGQLKWTPTPSQVGPHSVVVDVSDGHGGNARQSFTVVVDAAPINRPPTINTSPTFVASIGLAYSYDADASDPEGDPVTFELRTAPAGMSINPTTGMINWTPDATQLGIQLVSLAARDTAGNAAFQSYLLNVRPANRPPAIISAPVNLATPNEVYRYDVIASDPDGDRLAYQLTSAPAGMTIDALGRITWPATIADIGTHPITVVVSDPFGVSASQSFNLAVSGDDESPNVDVEFSESPANLGSLVIIHVSANDNVGIADLVLTVGGTPLPLDANGRAEFNADQVGTFEVVATATDAAGNFGEVSTALEVIDRSDVNAPDVAITSPSDEAVITRPVDVIGTADDDNLSFYTLEVAVLGTTSFTEIARGTTAVAGGVLGMLDPTTLQNDTYVLRLTAVDTGGNSASVDQIIHVEGDLKLGNFTLSFTDLTIPVFGVPITVARTYDTLDAGQSRDFGFGWRLDFRNTNLRTSVAPSNLAEAGIFNPFKIGSRVYVTLPGGKREAFTFRPEVASGFRGSFLGIFEPRFDPGDGVTSSLTVTPADLRISPDGRVFDFATGTPFNPTSGLFGGSYLLTTKEGIAYRIDGETGQLTTLSDTNDNVLRFSDSGITGPEGINVTFERDPQGRITSVIDPAGQRVRYQYDARGDLVAVSDRTGDTTEFVYRSDRPHYLEQVIDALGRTGIRTEYDAQGRLSRIVDAAGNPTQLAFDPLNQVATVTDARGNTTTEEYDSRGNTLSHIDALGGITRRTFDIDNNRLTETDPIGRTSTFTYDNRGDVLTETNPLGDTIISTYQAFTYGVTAEAAVEGEAALPFTRVTSSTDPLGNTIHISYDRKGNAIVHTDPLGNTTETFWDRSGNPIVFRDQLGNTTRNTYASGNRTQSIDANGHILNYSYDANGNPLSQTELDGGGWNLAYNAEGLPTSVGPIGLPQTVQYDALNQITHLTDPSGETSTLSYDALGNMTQITLPDGTIAERSTYDAVGNLLTVTDSLGNVTRYAYDAANQLIQTTYADGSTEKNAYNLAGELTKLTDARGNDTRYVYDNAGRQIQIIDALGGVNGTQYDAAGRVVATTDPLGHTTRFQYDASGQQVATVAADGSTTRIVFDAGGRLVQTIDAEGNATTNAYDPAGNLVSVTDALGNITRYEYGDRNERVAITDANGHITRFLYDTQRHLVEATQPNGDTDSSTYDSAGRLASTTDGNGKTTRYGYDVRGRLTTRTLPDSSQETYTYTSDGLVSSFTDARGTRRYDYDPLMRRLVRVTEPDGAQVSYGYDAAGNRISMTATVGVTSLTTTFTFDTLNRLETVTDPDLGVTRYTYDVASNLIQVELPNGSVETRSYDDLNRLLFLENRGAAGVISSQLYTLTPTGNRASVVEHDGRRVDYTYDDLYRLTREEVTDAVFGDRTFDYTYDDVGNRLTRNDTAEGLTEYTYDVNDRLLTETLAGDATQYTYDNNGNMLSRTSATDRAFYNWDFRDRLVSADTDGDGTVDVQNQYDDDGIRVSHTVEGEETRFLIDPLEEFAQVVLEYRPGGLIVASYVYGHELISQERDGARVFYHVDGLGSIRALTDAAGAVLNRYVYDAFGKMLHQTGVTANAYLFAGEQRDSTLGLDYLRARYYDPATGRFLSRDAFPGFDTLPLSLNKYLYALANPVNLTDPSGNFTLLELDIVALAQQFLKAYDYSSKAQTFFNVLGRTLQAIGGVMTLRTAASAFEDPAQVGTYFGGFVKAFKPFRAMLGRRAIVPLSKIGFRMVTRLGKTTYRISAPGTKPHVNAYTYPNPSMKPAYAPNTVYLGPGFFAGLPLLPPTPLDHSRLGTVIHEFAHLATGGKINDKGGDGPFPALKGTPLTALYNAENFRLAVQGVIFRAKLL